MSHSHRRTPRRFDVTVQDRRGRVPSPGRHVRLRPSTEATEVPDRDGIEVVARPRTAGERLKRSTIVANERRKATVARYAERRAELVRVLEHPGSTDEARRGGHLRAFGLSRVRVRQYAHAGYLPGVTTSSW